MYYPANGKNYVIKAGNKDEVEPSQVIKFPSKLMVLGFMGVSGHSDLNFVPEKTNVDAENLYKKVMGKVLIPTLNRSPTNGHISVRKISPEMSREFFMQDGTNSHMTKVNDKRLKENIPNYWEKGIWPENSPDLNPI